MGLQLRFKGDSTPIAGTGKRSDKAKTKSKKSKSVKEKASTGCSDPEEASSSTDAKASWAKARDARKIAGPCVILFPDAAKPAVMKVDGTTGEGAFKVIDAATHAGANADAESFALSVANTFVPTHIDNVFIVRRIAKGEVKASDDSSPESVTIRASSTGKLMSASRSGTVSFFTEAIGNAEQWLPTYLAETGTFAFQSLLLGTYLGIESPLKKSESAGWRITCDADAVNFAQRFVVRIQPRVSSKILNEQVSGKAGDRGYADSANMYSMSQTDRDAAERVALKLYGSEDAAGRVLRGAAAKGKLCETLLDLRAKAKSDKFCK